MDSTGNIGIGETSPYEKLHVTGDDAVDNKHYSKYLTAVIEEKNVGLQIIGEDETIGMAHIILTGVESSSSNKHWIISHLGPEADPANHFSIAYRTTSSATDFYPYGSGEKFVITTDGNVGIGCTNPASKLDISGDDIRIRNPQTPSSSTATGNKGEIAWDSNYIYVCVNTNTWGRVALTTTGW